MLSARPASMSWKLIVTVLSLSARRKVMEYKDSRMSLVMWFQTVVVVVQINEVN